MRRRDFIKLVAGSATAWPLVAQAQQQTMPVIGLLDVRSADTVGDRLPAFRQGLKQSGYVEGENVAIVYRWAENEIGRVPELVADLVGRKVNVIATVGNEVGLIAKKAIQSTPITFVVSQDPVSLGLVASLARPGGNVTGINFFSGELVGKQLGLLRELVPAASRIAVIVNPANASSAERTVKDVAAASPATGLHSKTFAASKRRYRGSVHDTCPRAVRRAPPCQRPLLQQSACSTGQPRDATRNPYDLSSARLRRSRRIDELRKQYYGRLAAIRGICRSHFGGR